jgi:hypothetical protein
VRKIVKTFTVTQGIDNPSRDSHRAIYPFKSSYLHLAALWIFVLFGQAAYSVNVLESALEPSCGAGLETQVPSQPTVHISQLFKSRSGLVNFMGPHEALFQTTDENVRILLTFRDYLLTEKGANATQSYTAPEIRLAFDNFLEQADQEWQTLNAQLQQLHAGIHKTRLEAQTQSRVVRFGGGTYPVVAHLGGREEGMAYLVQDGNRLVVIKIFHRLPANHNRRNQAEAFRDLKTAGVSVVDLLGEDVEENALKISFEAGLALSDIEAGVASGALPSKAIKLFLFHYSRFINESYRQFGAHIFNGLLPHANNVLFNPYTGTWRIIDTR